MTSAILALMVDAVSSVDLQVRIFSFLFSIIFAPLPPTAHTPTRLFVDFFWSLLTYVSFASFHLGISDAYYCAECTRLEKDRDGCPKIVNLGASRTDLFYERRRLGALYPALTPFRSYMSDRLSDPGFKKG